MKLFDEYKNFSEHECPYCQSWYVKIEIHQYDSVEWLEMLYVCLTCHRKWWVQYQLIGIEEE